MPLMRRRPLMRAAAVGGGAYYMGKRRAQAQQDEMDQEQAPAGAQSYDAPPPAYAPPPPPAYAPAPPAPGAGGLAPDAIERLQQLGQLHEQGVLTDDEFAQQKARLLGS
jgi:hypothetical protein